MLSSFSPVLDFGRNGLLIGLATTGPKRDGSMPELPTLSEAGLSGFDVRLWQGFTAPAGVPKPIVDKLARAIGQVLDEPSVKELLAKQGFAPLTGTPEEFDAFYRSEVVKWSKVIKASGMAIQ
jgi:tripartite-type tricarboxylate transporter receptor subunit TctC